jgi:hypothetical protein
MINTKQKEPVKQNNPHNKITPGYCSIARALDSAMTAEQKVQRARERERQLIRPNYDGTLQNIKVGGVTFDDFSKSTYYQKYNTYIQSGMASGGWLTVARGGFYYYYNLLNDALLSNYQIDMTVRFNSASFDQDQMITWAGEVSTNDYSSYFISPYKESDQYYLSLGFKDGANSKSIAKLNISKFGNATAKDCLTGVRPANIIIRKYDSTFYIFFNGNLAGTVNMPYRSLGKQLIIRNNVDLYTEQDGNTTVYYTNQYQFGTVLKSKC